MNIEAFFHKESSTLAYVVWDSATKDAIVIDAVLDYDAHAIKVSESFVDEIAAYAEKNGLTMHYAIDSHVHADHLTGQGAIKEKLGAKTAISEHVIGVQKAFSKLLELDIATDGSQWDVLLKDNMMLEAGSLKIKVLASPGHTPACICLQIEDAVFAGDVLFMPDFGTGRCDFPGGSAENLYDSIKRIYALPDATRIFVGHDYQPGGRALAYETSVAECKEKNKQLRHDTSREEFVQWRKERDAVLRPPRLIWQSLQVNAAAGALPAKSESGTSYLKLPINVFG